MSDRAGKTQIINIDDNRFAPLDKLQLALLPLTIGRFAPGTLIVKLPQAAATTISPPVGVIVWTEPISVENSIKSLSTEAFAAATALRGEQLASPVPSFVSTIFVIVRTAAGTVGLKQSTTDREVKKTCRFGQKFRASNFNFIKLWTLF